MGREVGHSDKADVSYGMGKRKMKVGKEMILGKNSKGRQKKGVGNDDDCFNHHESNSRGQVEERPGAQARTGARKASRIPLLPSLLLSIITTSYIHRTHPPGPD